jgi:hypothetical protein
MSKILFLILFFSISLFGITKNGIYKLYNNKNFKATCEKGTWILRQNSNDDTYLSVVGLSCVNSDMINTAIRISKYMGRTKMGRNNASFISSIFLTKKLLIQFVYDNIDLSNLSLPKANHFLSKIFENLSNKNYIKQNSDYIIKTDNKKYILRALKNSNNKIEIEIYNNNKLLSKHIYW